MYIDGVLAVPRLTPWEQLFTRRWTDPDDLIQADDLRVGAALLETVPGLGPAQARAAARGLLGQAIVDRLADLAPMPGSLVASQLDSLFAAPAVDDLAEWLRHGRDSLALTEAGQAERTRIEAELDATFAEVDRTTLWAAAARVWSVIPDEGWLSASHLGWDLGDYLADTWVEADLGAVLPLIADDRAGVRVGAIDLVTLERHPWVAETPEERAVLDTTLARLALTETEPAVLSRLAAFANNPSRVTPMLAAALAARPASE